MKIWEIDLSKNGQNFEAFGEKWIVNNGELVLERDRKYDITNKRFLKEIFEADFEPVIDWSKVEVDTPILVSTVNNKGWKHRHFAKYEDGYIYAWDDGKTSWTSNNTVCTWDFAKLPTKEELKNV